VAVSRRGAALFVALIVVLLGGLVVLVATMVAVGEIRAGTAWSEQEHAAVAGAIATVLALPAAEAGFPGLLPGETLIVGDTMALFRLSDSVALVSVQARSRLGVEVLSTLARAEPDTAGGIRLRVPARSRVRYHPIP